MAGSIVLEAIGSRMTGFPCSQSGRREAVGAAAGSTGVEARDTWFASSVERAIFGRAFGTYTGQIIGLGTVISR